MKSWRRRTAAGLVIIGALATACCSKDAQTELRDRLARGGQYFDQAKYDQAIVEFKGAVQADPLSGEAHKRLADAYDRNNDVLNAFRECVRAADLLPKDPDAQVRAGLFFLAAGKSDDAKGFAQKALKLNPRHIDALLLLGQATAGLRDLNGAMQLVQEALAIDPSRATYGALGQINLATGNLPAAEKAFQNAVSMSPKSIDAALALANFYFSTGRPKEAGEWFANAVAIDPKSGPASRALAYYYLANNRPAEAEAPLKAAAEASPLPQPRLALADYYYGTGKPTQARQILDQLEKEKLAFAEVRLRLAVLDFSDGKAASAYKILGEILAKEPQNGLALVLQGRFLLTQDRADEAQPALDKAVSVSPDLFPAHYWRGTAFHVRKKLDEASQSFVRALELRPGDAAALAQLSAVRLQQGRAEAAVTFAQQSTTSQPGYLLGHAALMKALLAQGNVAHAETEAALMAKRFPDALETKISLGMVAFVKRDFAGSAAAFQQATELSADSLEALSGLVSAKLALRKTGEAKAILEARLQKKPNDPNLLFLMSKVYEAEGDSGNREQTLKRIIAADPSNLPAYLELAHLVMVRGNLDETRKQYEALIAVDPKNVPALTVTALMLQIQNRRPEAIKRYQAALAVDPHAAIAANNLAMLIAEDGGNLDVALNLAQVAAGALPNAPEANDTLGWVYYLKGMSALAIPAFKVSVEKDRLNPIYHYHLGLAYSKAGDTVQARASLEEALRLKKDFPGAAEARKLLGR